jgi:hypothetical protein
MRYNGIIRDDGLQIHGYIDDDKLEEDESSFF